MSNATTWGLNGMFKELYMDELEALMSPINMREVGSTIIVEYRPWNAQNPFLLQLNRDAGEKEPEITELFVWEK